MKKNNQIPKEIQALKDLALDLSVSSIYYADELWQAVDKKLWEETRNPWKILQTLSEKQLKKLSKNKRFQALLEEHLEKRKKHLDQKGWFLENHRKSKLNRIAFFSMEFGLSESLPIYSGGLGILAGDYLKTASDLNVPIVGVGLLYQEGYFRQLLDAEGNQKEFYPFNDPGQLPIVEVLDKDERPLYIDLELPARKLHLRIWKVQVGRIELYLLDANDLLNSPIDRGITNALYAGEKEIRLLQEIILGIGGWKLLEKLKMNPEICHLNEGHAAFAILERTKSFMKKKKLKFHEALNCIRAGNLFTTHTAVSASFDRFEPDLLKRYLGSYVESLGISFEEFLTLGRDQKNSEEKFNMGYLAIRGSYFVNGVSKLHGKVSQKLFSPLFPDWPEHCVPVESVTNGIHIPSWESPEANRLWLHSCGGGCWLGELENIGEKIAKIPDAALWSFRSNSRKKLICYARSRLKKELLASGIPDEKRPDCDTILDPDILTLGFARRFATYKRTNLLLKDPERLLKLLHNEKMPVQLILAGKAHPQDEEGKRLVNEWVHFIRNSDARSRVMYLSDYDISLAERLVQGVDVWINTPRRPWEASGTSGMKLLVNGGLNVSELDGWWAEAYNAGVGWALGDGQNHGDDTSWDNKESEDLYNLLENEIIPMFYERKENGPPKKWLTRIRQSMSTLTPEYSTNRMLREYTEKYYLSCLNAYRNRAEKKTGVEFTSWLKSLEEKWHDIKLLRLDWHEEKGQVQMEVEMHIGKLEMKDLQMRLMIDSSLDDQCIIFAHKSEKKKCCFVASLPAEYAKRDSTLLLLPFYPDARFPMESLMHWSYTNPFQQKQGQSA